jgi:hypothetical protein
MTAVDLTEPSPEITKEAAFFNNLSQQTILGLKTPQKQDVE